jgi:hypothetical protein
MFQLQGSERMVIPLFFSFFAFNRKKKQIYQHILMQLT